MAAINVCGLRVKELRSELQKRGLEKNGVKATLLARLSKALELENANQRVIVADVNNVPADTPDASKINAPKKPGNKSENDDCQILLKQILSAISGIDERLKTLEHKFSDQISIIAEHIDSQNENSRRVEEERRNLQKISELVKPQTENTRSIPGIPTQNRFDVLAGEDDDTTSPPSYDEQIKDYRQKHRTRRVQQYDVIVAGDSIIKHIEGQRLSRARKVKCQPNPGAKVEQISPVSVCEMLKRDGEAIIHAGTNNNMEGPGSVHDKLVSLCDAVCATGRRGCISGIIHRRWETPYERKRVDTLNHHLQLTTQERGWGYIDNSNVGDRHLGVDGVHLNKSGQATFAGNLSRYINRHQRHRRFSRQGREHPELHSQDERTPPVGSMQDHRVTHRVNQQPRSYADAAGRSVTPRAFQQEDFNQGFPRSRLKSSHHQPMADPMQWQNYLHFVREVTGDI